MYSMEKLAKGIKDRSREQPHMIEINPDAAKYENNCFADARKYRVITDEYQPRPRGAIYRTKKK